MPGRKPTVTDTEILRAVALSPSPVATASMVSQQIELSRQGTDKRLRALVDMGLAETHDVGGARVYWLTEEGKRAVSTTNDED